MVSRMSWPRDDLSGARGQKDQQVHGLRLEAAHAVAGAQRAVVWVDEPFPNRNAARRSCLSCIFAALLRACGGRRRQGSLARFGERRRVYSAHSRRQRAWGEGMAAKNTIWMALGRGAPRVRGNAPCAGAGVAAQERLGPPGRLAEPGRLATAVAAPARPARAPRLAPRGPHPEPRRGLRRGGPGLAVARGLGRRLHRDRGRRGLDRGLASVSSEIDAFLLVFRPTQETLAMSSSSWPWRPRGAGWGDGRACPSPAWSGRGRRVDPLAFSHTIWRAPWPEGWHQELALEVCGVSS